MDQIVVGTFRPLAFCIAHDLAMVFGLGDEIPVATLIEFLRRTL